MNSDNCRVLQKMILTEKPGGCPGKAGEIARFTD
jgi:hypothetical protein